MELPSVGRLRNRRANSILFKTDSTLESEQKQSTSFKPGILALPVFIAAILRLIYWLQVRDEAWFMAPGMDPEFYWQWASAIISGRGAEFLPFPRAPLYAYLLAAIRLLFGGSWLVPRLMNLAADLATLVLIQRLAKRLAGQAAALIAGILYAICGAAVYFTGELLMTSLETFLATAFLYSLARARETRAARPAIWSGVWLGLTALCRPNSLFLAPFSAGYLFLGRLKSSPSGATGKGAGATIGHIAALLAVILPVTVVNYSASHRLVPIAVQGGVNFYIGNARQADGWSSTLPGVGNAWLDEDALHIAEQDAGRRLDPAQSSAQLWKMGWREIKANPPEWLRLTAKKLLILTNIREAGNNRPLTLARDSSWLILLLFPISLGLLLPFAVYGAMVTNRHTITRVILMFSAVYAASILLFFINMRYRMPLIPSVAVLGGAGMALTHRQLIEHSLKPALLLAILLSCMLALPPWVGGDFESPAQVHFVAGNAYLRLNRSQEALRCYAQVAAVDSAYPELHLNRGVALMMAGDSVGAADEFKAELRQNDKNPRAWNNLGVIMESRREDEEALACYKRAMESSAYAKDPRINAVRLELMRGDERFKSGDLKGAEDYFRRAAELSVGDPAPIFRLALVAGARGDLDGARSLLNQALALDSDYAPAAKLLRNLPER